MLFAATHVTELARLNARLFLFGVATACRRFSAADGKKREMSMCKIRRSAVISKSWKKKKHNIYADNHMVPSMVDVVCQTDLAWDVISRVIDDGLQSEEVLNVRLKRIIAKRNILRFHLAGFYTIVEKEWGDQFWTDDSRRKLNEVYFQAVARFWLKFVPPGSIQIDVWKAAAIFETCTHRETMMGPYFNQKIAEIKPSLLHQTKDFFGSWFAGGAPPQPAAQGGVAYVATDVIEKILAHLRSGEKQKISELLGGKENAEKVEILVSMWEADPSQVTHATCTLVQVLRPDSRPKCIPRASWNMMELIEGSFSATGDSFSPP